MEKTTHNRVAWAKQYLKNSELIESPEKGSNILKSKPERIDLRLLKNLDKENQPEVESKLQETHIEENKTPEELIENDQSLYTESLKKIISKIKEC